MRLTFSIRTYITALVMASLLPVLVFAALLVNRAAINEQEMTAQTMRDTARAGAIDLNRRIGGLVALALSIADARTLQDDELPRFHRRWSHVVEREGLTAALYEPSGQQVLNTTTPLGTTLPAQPEVIGNLAPAGDTAAIEPRVGTQNGEMIISINVPVLRGGKLVYILNLRVTNAIVSVVDQQILLTDQIAELMDRNGATIHATRQWRNNGFQPSSDFPARIKGQNEGSFQTLSADGTPVFVAFSRVPSADWVLAVAMPSERMFAPVRQSVFRLGILAAITLLVAGGFAWAIGRGVARAMTGLTSLAASLGDSTGVRAPISSGIREVNAVATSMRAASDTMLQQIRQRERAESQLIQSQKMEAVGQLTGGMAHDFNNLLAVIVGCLELLRERAAEDPASHEFVEEAMSAAARGSELTRQLLVFARRQPLVPVRCDLNDIITVFVRLLRRTLGEDIVIDLQLAPDLWPVLADRVQFEATITNLATNARHAMPNGGTLTIETRNTRLDEDYAAVHADVSAGDYVLIEMRDTGTGMTPDILAKVFDPFFTTKEPGSGTGLGLSMVFGFVKQSGGHISVYSEMGEGTTFRLYFPPARDGSPAGMAPAAVASSVPEGHGETILVVEDNSVLRRILCRQLTGANYRVLEADSGKSALEMIQHGEAFDLLLTDIVMPGGMNGHELARLASVLRPELKIVLTSGFSDVRNGGASMSTTLRFLRKPYSREDLSRVLFDALNGETR